MTPPNTGGLGGHQLSWPPMYLGPPAETWPAAPSHEAVRRYLAEIEYLLTEGSGEILAEGDIPRLSSLRDAAVRAVASPEAAEWREAVHLADERMRERVTEFLS